MDEQMLVDDDDKPSDMSNADEKYDFLHPQKKRTFDNGIQ